MSEEERVLLIHHPPDVKGTAFYTVYRTPAFDLAKWRDEYEHVLRSHTPTHDHAAALTLLHAVRAHYRGKVHGPRRRLTYEQLGRLRGLTPHQVWTTPDLVEIAHGGGTRVVELNHAQQARLYEKAIQEYALKTAPDVPRAGADGGAYNYVATAGAEVKGG